MATPSGPESFFTIIDTGGYVTGSDDKFESQIRKQVEMALEECAAVIFMVDCQQGLTGYDQEFANIIRKSKKPVFIAANKADTPQKTMLGNEFYELGMGRSISYFIRKWFRDWRVVRRVG